MMETFLQQTARSIMDNMDWKDLSRTTLLYHILIFRSTKLGTKKDVILVNYIFLFLY